MVPLAEEIFRTRQVRTVDGSATIPIHSETPERVAEFLKSIVVQTKARATAEVGLAYGLSALSICEGLLENGGGRHIAIDPHQFTGWSGIGLENVRRAGFGDILELREAPSYVALPQLLAERTQLDFAYIDGWHTFDYALVDFFFFDLLLRVGGVIAIDDCSFSGIHAACRYIARNRAYRVLGVSEDIASWRKSKKRLIFERAVQSNRMLQRLVKSEFLHADPKLGFTRATRCIAFQKLATDTRMWDEHHEF
jgi:predicted O-methyltransferase YrrM